MNLPPKPIYYSDKYCDDMYEYRHVVLPKEMVPLIPKNRLMTESEWREMGVQQSQGWVHYMIHSPEPHILLFKRPKLPSENGVPSSIKPTTETITTTTSNAATKQNGSKFFV